MPRFEIRVLGNRALLYNSQALELQNLTTYIGRIPAAIPVLTCD
jgi:hypothetical protein